MAINKRTKNSKCCQGCGEKGTLCTVGGTEATVENSMTVPQKLKIVTI